MNSINQTFEAIDVSDIFWNQLTEHHRTELSNIVGDLIECRTMIVDDVNDEKAWHPAIFTCIHIGSIFYEEFIKLAIKRTPSGLAEPDYNVLSVDDGSSGLDDNMLRIRVLEALIGQIRIYQSGYERQDA